MQRIEDPGGRRPSRRVRRRARSLAALVAAGQLVALTPAPASVSAAAGPTPPSGQQWIVAMGDSYIAGEGTRWAGNGAHWDENWYQVDTGSQYDTADLWCHRNANSQIGIGELTKPMLGANVSMPSVNLACSGATTVTRKDPDFANRMIPGIDHYSFDGKDIGQLALLKEFASKKRVGVIVLSIGGNDFHFADIVRQCVEDYALHGIDGTALGSSPDYCDNDGISKQYTDPAMVQKIAGDITAAIGRVKSEMAGLGYGSRDYRIILQTYPMVFAGTGDNRHTELNSTGAPRERLGPGCPLWDEDIDWANNVVIPGINSVLKHIAAGFGDIAVLDLYEALLNHRICEKGVGGTLAPNTWRDSGAVDRAEWAVALQVSLEKQEHAGAPYVQEKVHPNAWGAKAIRNCLRQMVSTGQQANGLLVPTFITRHGYCRAAFNGLSARGEPNMMFSNDAKEILPTSPPARTWIDPWVVSVGDAMSAGTGARYAGNVRDPFAWGPVDTTKSLVLDSCAQSYNAPIHINALGGESPHTFNLACAGAGPHSVPGTWGLDWAVGGTPVSGQLGGITGQLGQLEVFAKEHRVEMVVVSLGAHEFGLDGLLASCRSAYLNSTATAKQRCTPAVRNHTMPPDDPRYLTMREELLGVASALRRAGYGPNDVEIVVQTYPTTIAPSTSIQPPDVAADPQRIRSCPYWNDDIDYINSHVAFVNQWIAKVVQDIRYWGDVSMSLARFDNLLDGHRLCEKGTTDAFTTGVWNSPGRSDVAEWAPRHNTPNTPFRFTVNAWGSLAMRACLTNYYAKGKYSNPALTFDPNSVGDMTCRAVPGVDPAGQPRVLPTFT